MEKKQREIAKKYKVSDSTVSLILSGQRFTKTPKLAMELGEYAGRKGIEFINPKYRTIYSKAYPKLGKVAKGIDE